MDRQADVDSRQQAARKSLRLQPGKRFVAVFHQAIESAGRRLAGDGVVQRGGEPVDVRPGPLLRRRELFGRGIARCEDRRHGLGAIGHRHARRAEIDQGRLVLGAQHNVGGLDVAMQEARLVHAPQAVDQRPEDHVERCRRERTLGLDPLLERLAAQQFHDNVGGAVGLKEIEHLHNRCSFVEVGQDAAFFDEMATPPIEIAGYLSRARQHGVPVLAHRECYREVFLERHLATELGVAGKIGDAEPALAQHAQNLVAADRAAHRQGDIINPRRGVGGGRSGGCHVMGWLVRSNARPSPGVAKGMFCALRDQGEPRP